MDSALRISSPAFVLLTVFYFLETGDRGGVKFDCKFKNSGETGAEDGDSQLKRAEWPRTSQR